MDQLARARLFGEYLAGRRKGCGPRDSAAREALEEAGLVRTDRRPVDRTLIITRNGWPTVRPGAFAPVETFAFEVAEQLGSWPEQDQRRTRWFTLHEAADAVQEP